MMRKTVKERKKTMERINRRGTTRIKKEIKNQGPKIQGPRSPGLTRWKRGRLTNGGGSTDAPRAAASKSTLWPRTTTTTTRATTTTKTMGTMRTRRTMVAAGGYRSGARTGTATDTPATDTAPTPPTDTADTTPPATDTSVPEGGGSAGISGRRDAVR